MIAVYEAARRGAPRNGARAYAVVLEPMAGHFRVYREALSGFREKLEADFREPSVLLVV